LKKETLEKLAAFCKGPDYAPYIRKLLVQGLIKIEEQEVEVQCKAEDKAIVAKVVRYKSSIHPSIHPFFFPSSLPLYGNIIHILI
jgi:vacuolar-type H+-ATPase subunit E/Vma4